MSAVQAGGGKGSGQKPGGAAGGRPASGAKPKPAPGTRGASGGNGAGQSSGRRPAPATKTGSGGGKGGGGGGGKGNAPRASGYRPGAKPPQRFSMSTIAFAAVAVVVVVVVAFVVIKVTGKSTPSNSSTPPPVLVPADPAVVNAVTSVPASTADAVGLPSTDTVNPPTYKAGQPKLTIDGKPGAVFIGAEFCPYCAAERWAIIMAYSKFGTFSNLHETTSSPWDSYPSTATFSFYGATYKSPYLTFVPIEHESNDTGPNGGRALLVPLNSLESHLWSTYDSPEGYPFMDIGNKVFITTPSYLPSTLAGLDQQDIATKLKNPNDPVTQAIVGTANYMTAGICAITGQKPASACSPTVVAKAAKAMGLS